MKPAFVLPVLLLALAAAKDDPLAGRAAGVAADCIDVDEASGVQITDAGTIIYQRTARRLWVTTPVGGCPGLRPWGTLIVERFGSQICRGDRFRVVEAPSRIPSGVCRFGAFVPWEKVAASPTSPTTVRPE